MSWHASHGNRLLTIEENEINRTSFLSQQNDRNSVRPLFPLRRYLLMNILDSSIDHFDFLPEPNFVLVHLELPSRKDVHEFLQLFVRKILDAPSFHAIGESLEDRFLTIDGRNARLQRSLLVVKCLQLSSFVIRDRGRVGWWDVHDIKDGYKLCFARCLRLNTYRVTFENERKPANDDVILTSLNSIAINISTLLLNVVQ